MPPNSALILEDDPICRNLLAELLVDINVAVTAFPSPVNFLDCCSGDPCSKETACIGAILTDNEMPGMNGLVFLKELDNRSCKIPAHCRAIFSGRWSSADREQARQLGCRVFSKPFSIDQIYDWVNSLPTPGT